MPFTLAHAAAALPFRRTRLIFSAVVVGCFAPDFEYFLRLTPEGRFGHTLPGLFAFDLPLGLVILCLFHLYAKEPLWEWLPESFRERVRLGPRALPVEGFGQFVLLSVSILAGATTHILWDSFTHPALWLARHWHFLTETVALPMVGNVRYARVFQYTSTIIGLTVLLVWFLRQPRVADSNYPRDNGNSRVNERMVLAIVLAIALGGGVVRAFVGTGVPSDLGDIKLFVAQAVVTTITVFWVEAVICGIVRERSRSHVLVG